MIILILDALAKIDLWTGDGKYDAAEATLEVCDDGNICCKRLLDKNLKKGAKGEFLMSEDFKNCWRNLKKKNLYLSRSLYLNSTRIDEWKPRMIGLQFYHQQAVLCRVTDVLKVEPGKESRLPLMCDNHPGTSLSTQIHFISLSINIL